MARQRLLPPFHRRAREPNLMRMIQSRALFALTLSATCASAAVIGYSVAAQSITAERIAALPRAQQAAWRDYLARSVRQMQADRAFLEAELQSAGLTSELIPPNGSAARRRHHCLVPDSGRRLEQEPQPDRSRAPAG